MTRKVLIAIGGLLAVGLVVGGASAAGDKAARAGERMAKAVERGDAKLGPLAQLLGKAATRLELTDAQQGDIKAKLVAHREEIGGALGKVRDATRRLDDLTLAEPVDQDAVRAAATELGQALGDAALVKAKVFAEIKPLLTPEQTEKLKTLRAEMHGKVDKAVGRVKPGQAN